MDRLLVLDHSLYSHVIIVKRHSLNSWSLWRQLKLSIRPENETKLLNMISNIQQIDATIVGRKNTRPQFSLSIPPTPFNESSKTYIKGSQSYAHPHSVQHFWTRNGGLCRKNNGHQTLAYLLHIMTNIVEAMFQHVVTTLMPLGEIATEYRRSRY